MSSPKRVALSAALAASILFPVAAAEAADPIGLVKRPAPVAVDYVKVCDAYGEGFFYIPGGETCLKIGGYVRAEYRVFSWDKDFAAGYGVDNGTGKPESNRYTSRARASLTLDARTNTEFGLLRSFAEVQTTVDSGSGTPSITLNRAFVQWGGLTAGRTQSFFDFYTGDHYSSYFETAHSDTILNLLGYTFSFNSALSATISIEDSTTGSATRRWTSGGALVGGYGGNKYPDIVGALKATGGWGSLQVMAAAHNVQGIRQDFVDEATKVAFVGGNNGDKWGYAIGAGATLNVPIFGASDAWSIQAVYSKGAVSYVSPDWFFANDYTAVAPAPSVDKIRLTEAWSVASGYTHGWNDAWTSGVTVSYAEIDHKIFGKDLDYGQFDAGVNLVWSGPSGLSVGGEIEYKNVDFKAKGDGSTDAWVGLVRIERKF
jgi:hypothetical protein